MLKGGRGSSGYSWLGSLLVVSVTAAAVPRLPEGQTTDDPFFPGLVASIRDGSGRAIARVDHHLSFHWGETPPDPRLGGKEFHASWQGRLIIRARGDYRFF